MDIFPSAFFLLCDFYLFFFFLGGLKGAMACPQAPEQGGVL
jgi:hypothetical protein